MLPCKGHLSYIFLMLLLPSGPLRPSSVRVLPPFAFPQDCESPFLPEFPSQRGPASLRPWSTSVGHSTWESFSPVPSLRSILTASVSPGKASVGSAPLLPGLRCDGINIIEYPCPPCWIYCHLVLGKGSLLFWGLFLAAAIYSPGILERESCFFF